MPEQPPAERIHNFDEVPCGCTPMQAMAEAKRCLQCKRASCLEGCPVALDIPGFLALVADGDFQQSPNPMVPNTTSGLETGRHGNIVVDEQMMKTSNRGCSPAVTCPPVEPR
jgi:hypothetical protein